MTLAAPFEGMGGVRSGQDMTLAAQRCVKYRYIGKALGQNRS